PSHAAGAAGHVSARTPCATSNAAPRLPTTAATGLFARKAIVPVRYEPERGSACTTTSASAAATTQRLRLAKIERQYDASGGRQNNTPPPRATIVRNNGA